MDNQITRKNVINYKLHCDKKLNFKLHNLIACNYKLQYKKVDKYYKIYKKKKVNKKSLYYN
jgi:hypothetical protein